MIYKSIAERLRIRLNSADFTLNSLLPGEKKLAEEFAVSRMTIRKAIDLLVAWGLVVRRHGSGTYLVRKDVLHQTASLTGLVEGDADDFLDCFIIPARIVGGTFWD